MRISLVNYHAGTNVNTRLAASLNKRQGSLPPLGLAYLGASLLGAGHEVQIVDAVVDALSKEQFAQRLRDFSPTVVGISAMTPVIHGALEAAEIAKKMSATVVLGGPHLAVMPKETLSHRVVDYGMAGEGEETFVQFCDALENNCDLSDIAGLVYRAEGKICFNPPAIIENIDALPMPAYHLLPMHKYSSIIGLHPTATMLAVRGCPYRCGYCFKTPSDRKIRTRSVDLVVDEMQHLVNTYGVREIMFYNDYMPASYMIKLAEKILERNLKVSWESPQRVDMVDLGMYPLLKRSGCRMLRFGVEQGNAEQLASLDKNITLTQVKEAFSAAQKAGIKTFAYFIIGYMGETPSTIRDTIKFAKEINPAYVMFTKAVPMPSTKLFDDAVRKGLVSSDYWSNFSLDSGAPPIPALVDDTDMWVKRAYRAFYLRPGKIFEHFGYIRSWYDVRKYLEAGAGIIFFRNK
jgi:radical SAM superfamily enzyme YgiQ (UPF0313 family)